MYLSKWELFQESVRFVSFSKLEVRVHRHLRTAVFGSDEGLVGLEVIWICVERLKQQKFIKLFI